MIILQLSGGIGNQLFQYAFGKAFAIRNRCKLVLDVQSFNYDVLREFALDNYSIEAQIATIEEINRVKNGSVSFSKRLFAMFGVRRINYFDLPYLIEPAFSYDENVVKYRKRDVYFQGYWQSEKYFNSIRSVLLHDFKLKKQVSVVTNEWLLKIKSSQSVSVHIRRGDYISNSETNSFHGICPISYYEKALDYFTKKDCNTVFFIFSDDIAWAKETFNAYQNCFAVSDVPYDYEELFLLSKCKNNIIANSTFSWWGAWLNENSEKIVIAPEKWFENDTMQAQAQWLIPESWIKI